MLNADKKSFAEIYDLCAPTAFSLACRMLGNESEAEDAVQHAFLSLWKHEQDFDAGKGRISTWLYVFVRNRCIDIIRQRRNQSAVSLDGNEDEPAAFYLSDKSPSLDDQLSEQEQRTQIKRALETLPEPQRKVINAAYFEGLTQQEIAEKFSEPLGTIKTRMRLATMKLAELLKAEAKTV